MMRFLFPLLMIGAGVALIFLKPDWVIVRTEIPFGWLLAGYGAASILWTLLKGRKKEKK